MKKFAKLQAFFWAGALIAAIMTVVTASPVLADTPHPDSQPLVEEVRVWRNLLETGDRLYVIYANIPYATTPDDPVTSTFIWQIVDTDNVTILGSTVGYAYNDDGYGYNVWSLYFDAAANLTWEQTYLARLIGNPAFFESPPVYSNQIGANDYTSFNATADVQSELTTWVINTAHDLDNKWGLSAANSLIIELETATVLSAFGETVFRGCIFGLQAMAPNAFRVVLQEIDIDERTWGTDYADNLSNQWAGTWVETAMAGGQALFNTGYDLVTIIMMGLGCVGLVYANAKLQNDIWMGAVDIAYILIVFARLGFYPLGFLAMVCALCVLFIGAKIFRVF
jgi:hypothetical protein